MTATHRHAPRRKLDGVNLLLLLVSIASGVGAYLLIDQGASVLVIVPSIVVATIAALHLIKYEAPRD